MNLNVLLTSKEEKMKESIWLITKTTWIIVPILLSSILFTCTSCGVSQNTITNKIVEQTIFAREHQALDRWAAGDPLGFAMNFADDATYFDDIGAHKRLDGREEIQKYLASLEGKIPKHTYELIDPKVQVYGDIAIATLRYESSIDGVPGPPWKATDIYRLTNSNWKIVHANWSLVKEE
jgi:uncharacterized protein (TIGR02246 family)